MDGGASEVVTPFQAGCVLLTFGSALGDQVFKMLLIAAQLGDHGKDIGGQAQIGQLAPLGFVAVGQVAHQHAEKTLLGQDRNDIVAMRFHSVIVVLVRGIHAGRVQNLLRFRHPSAQTSAKGHLRAELKQRIGEIAVNEELQAAIVGIGQKDPALGLDPQPAGGQQQIQTALEDDVNGQRLGGRVQHPGQDFLGLQPDIEILFRFLAGRQAPVVPLKGWR